MDANGGKVRQLTRNKRIDTTPQWSPDGTRIAFASDRARVQEPEIWVMRADGTGARRVIANPTRRNVQDIAYSPAWSPDGTRLVFSANRAGAENPELYAVRIDGTGLKRLTFTRGTTEVLGDDSMPDWARDGATIVFVSNRQGQSDIWRMNADRSAQRPIVRTTRADDWNPRLSADGSRIAFTRLTGGGNRSVWVMDANGSGARSLGPGFEPDWQD